MPCPEMVLQVLVLHDPSVSPEIEVKQGSVREMVISFGSMIKASIKKIGYH